MTRSYVYPSLPSSVEKNKRHALIIMPFFGQDASSLAFNDYSAALRRQGYVVHALMYNDASYRPGNRNWDFVYCLKFQSVEYGKIAKNESGDYVNGVDDWAGEELPLFVEKLDAAFNFEICICNYIFLSRAFDGLKNSTRKILVTHDVFSHRNRKLIDRKVEELGFSVFPEDEAKALNRADYVVAVQPEEAEFFKSLVSGKKRVDTVYYMPPKKFFDLRQSGKELVVGYIGSSHAPNVVALLDFVRHVDLTLPIRIKVAGSICGSLDAKNLPSNVTVVGRVDKVEDFYRDCDVFINPDTLESGIKIKCIEALSFGKPLVCTVQASKGIPVHAPYHQAKSIQEVASFIEQIAKDPSVLGEMRDASRNTYDALNAGLSIDRYIDEIANQKPLISVIMPTFKVERYFAQCLESVINQTLRNIEIIPVDDGSPDRCGEMMDRYAERDARIKPIHQVNKGYGAAVNAGLAAARGEYVAIVETDDWIERDMLELLYDSARQSKPNIVKGNFAKHQEGKPPVANSFRHIIQGEREAVNPAESLELMIYESSIWSAIYKRSFLEANGIRMLETTGASFQDVVWKFHTYSNTDEVILIDRPLYNYRVFAAGSSSAANGKEKAHFVNYSHIKSFLKEHSAFDKYAYFYYVHQFFDFAFHSNRLKGDALLSYYADAKDVIEEAISRGYHPDNLSLHPDINDYYQRYVLPVIRVITSASLDDILKSMKSGDPVTDDAVVVHAENGNNGQIRALVGAAPQSAGARFSREFAEFLHVDGGFLVEVEYLNGKTSLVPVMRSRYDGEDLKNLLKLHDSDFVTAAYWMLLQRAPDSKGLRYYTDRLRAGMPRENILAGLRFSHEGAINLVQFDLLDKHLKKHRWMRNPTFGFFVRWWFGVRDSVGRKQMRAIENSLYTINRKLYS